MILSINMQDLEDKDGMTVLMTAAACGFESIVQALMAYTVPYANIRNKVRVLRVSSVYYFYHDISLSYVVWFDSPHVRI